MDSALDVTLALAATFERLDVPYLVGGSLASSLYGEPRSTQDVDFVAFLEPDHVAPLVASIEKDFYVDLDRVRRAVARKASFNALHLKTMFKADVFVPERTPSSLREMSRRRVELAPDKAIWVASAEDVVLQKLVCYRKGNEVSDRQWRDVLSVLEVGGAKLDDEYLDESASELGVADLLERARRRTD